jgi:chemotaxis protein methyltransferase CheR
MPNVISSADLTEAQFSEISELVKRLCGINLHDGKKELVKARLNKRLRMLGIADFREYIDCLKGPEGFGEITAMLDALSTNLTYFFREHKHFEFLQHKALPDLVARHEHDRRLRLWSAGCSSGDEPYSLAITLLEALPPGGWDAAVLATDLSTKILARARDGTYTREHFRETPAAMVARYFTRTARREEDAHRINDRPQEMVTFARLNLMDNWPMRGQFDVIFCRNVMIYFDKPTQNQLVHRFWNALAPGGYFFIGHSESLTGVRHELKYVEPTVYQKQ